MRRHCGVAVMAPASTFIVPIDRWLLLPVSLIVASQLHLVVDERLMVVSEDFSMAGIGLQIVSVFALKASL